MRENTPPRIQDIEVEENDELVFIPEDDFEAIFEPHDIDDSADDDEFSDFIEQAMSESSTTNVKDDSIVSFAQHAAPVFTCAFHPTRDWAVTGGEDDRAFVWNTQTGEVIKEIDRHKDTVTEAHFNFDGTYLATADLAGEIQVFKIKDDINRVWEYSMGDMSWMKWHPAANVLLAGSLEGEIYIWRIPSGDCKILPGSGERCETAELTGDGKKIFAGYGAGTVKLWDIKSNSVIMEVNANHPMAHKENVSTVACDKENPFYMSGSEDRKILFHTNNGPVGGVEASGSVECVAFAPSSEFKVAASGSLHGEIAIWDYAKCTLRTLCEHPEMDDGITVLKWISEHILLVGTLGGHIFGYDARSGARKFTLSGHKSDIYDLQYNAREGTVLSVSEDNTAKIFKCPELTDC